MTLIRWEPFAELSMLQGEMNRLFNTFGEQPGRGSVPARRWVPPMDLVETGDHYTLRADLPGLTEADIDIQLQDNVLTIAGERRPAHEQAQEGYYRLERSFGAFSRSITLPEGVEPSNVNAYFDRGVLEVTIPKPAQKQPHKVSIAVAPQDETFELEGLQNTETAVQERELAGVAG